METSERNSGPPSQVDAMTLRGIESFDWSFHSKIIQVPQKIIVYMTENAQYSYFVLFIWVKIYFVARELITTVFPDLLAYISTISTGRYENR